MLPSHWITLGKALEHFQRLGYLPIDCPWHANPNAISITLPQNASGTIASTGMISLHLVGSAEQSLIDLALQGLLPEGQPLCCLTPCFRLEDADRSPLHHPYFAKVELGCFWTTNPPPFKRILERAQLFQEHARSVHGLLLGQEPELGPDFPETVRNHHGWLRDSPLPDLQFQGIEIGSYGARSWKSLDSSQFLFWAYGTGLALPRALEALTPKPDRLIR